MGLKEQVQKDTMTEPKDFETAIGATGFGLFNLMLLLVAIPSCIATVFETSTMSYILPSAECDLKLNLLDKGSLNAVTYAGMITSAIAWGFIADTKGRKKVLVFGYLADAVCALGGSLSQNLTTLMIFKFFGGFVVCGPFAVLMSYMTEFHATKYRARVMMVIGMLFSIATLLLPMLAWLILPNSWNFYWFNGSLVIHSWQVFLAVCALPSLIAGSTYIFLPESPKFLMARGRNEEALNILKTVYSINCRKSKQTYPFSSLIEEAPQKNKKQDIFSIDNKCDNKEDNGAASTTLHFMRKGFKQLRPMFSKPYLGHSLNIYTMQFCILLGLNTIRLWLPQLFTSIEEFKIIQSTDSSSEASDLCAMIEYSVNKTQTIISGQANTCEVVISETTYINTIIVGVSGLIGYFIAGGLINALGNKWILSLTISGVCGLSMYWATNSLTTLILSSIYVTVGSIGATSLLGIVVNLFPTSLRTMIVSISMMFGRLGALIGNILFPYFMSLGCLPPFLMVGFIMMIAVALGCILPITHKSALK